MNSVAKKNKDTRRLKQSLKILRDYLEELGVKQPQETQTTYHISKVAVKVLGVEQPQERQTTYQTTEMKFGPRYPSVDVKEPPMEIPVAGLQDDDVEIPRNLFFQPIPLSDKANKAEKRVQLHHKKEIEEKMLLPISIATLIVLLILLGCSAIGIYECTKEKRAQDQCQTTNTQAEEFKMTISSAIMTIVDEVSSFSDESQATHDRYEKVPPHEPPQNS
ncbi:uncharacterized protein PHA67_006073 isoform 2-T2 [Liasis olivaceus]